LKTAQVESRSAEVKKMESALKELISRPKTEDVLTEIEETQGR
jgi:hypothetical protein